MTERPRFTLDEQKDREALLDAARRFLKAKSKVADIRVTCDRVEGAFARFRAQDPTGTVESISGFAKRAKDGRWEILAVGSFFDPPFFKQHSIPEKLRT